MRITLGLALCLLIALPLGAQDLEIHHINIGQGDATLILGPVQNGNRVSVLIDAGDITSGGKPDGGAIVLAALQRLGISRLDVFIATHYDADHIGGIVTGAPQTHGSSFVLGADNVPGSVGDDDGDGVADWLDAARTLPDPEELGRGDDIVVTTFLDRGDTNPPSSATYDKYIGIASSMGARLSATSQTSVDNFLIDLGAGARLDLLTANGFVRARGTRVANVNTENERSLGFLLTYKSFHYLIAGDLTGRAFGQENAQVEQAVAQWLAAQQIDVDVLHANHHGANNGSADDFLQVVQPEVVVISAGNGNPHHHPHAETLVRLANAGAQYIYQTNWGTTEGETPPEVRQRQAIFQGDVVITTDGTMYEISTRRRFSVDRVVP